MPRICFASFAIRSSFVETVPGVGVPAIVPPIGSVTRQLLPSTGSLGRLPPLRRYYSLLRLLTVRPAPPRFLCSAVPAPPCGGAGDDEVSQVPGEPTRA